MAPQDTKALVVHTTTTMSAPECAVTSHVTVRTSDLTEDEVREIAADLAATWRTGVQLVEWAHGIHLELDIHLVIAEARIVIPLQVT